MIREANIIWQYIDESNLIMPWYTLPCLEWLKKHDVSKWNVFEYGAGYSTIWWRANCNTVRSVEHSESWAKAMDAIFIADKNNFIDSIDDTSERFDCIIVDGKWREECVDFCITYVASGGYLIIDNWGQEDFPNIQYHESRVFKGWEKIIFAQPNHSDWKTAVFKRP